MSIPWQGDVATLGTGNTMYDRLKEQGFATIDSFYRAKGIHFCL
ncbi:MAG: hypothetical protein WDO16_11880 [Bacteroidota bacterium]